MNFAACFVVLLLSLVPHQVSPYSNVLVPALDTIEIVNSSIINILHQVVFNESETTHRVYAGFNFSIFPFSGEYLNRSVQVDYDLNCGRIFCGDDFSHWQFTNSVGERCENIRIRVSGHPDVNNGILKFHLYEDILKTPIVISSMKVTVAFPDDSVTTESVTTAITPQSSPSTADGSSDRQTEDDTCTCSDDGGFFLAASIIMPVLVVANVLLLVTLIFIYMRSL